MNKNISCQFLGFKQIYAYKYGILWYAHYNICPLFKFMIQKKEMSNDIPYSILIVEVFSICFISDLGTDKRSTPPSYLALISSFGISPK